MTYLLSPLNRGRFMVQVFNKGFCAYVTGKPTLGAALTFIDDFDPDYLTSNHCGIYEDWKASR